MRMSTLVVDLVRVDFMDRQVPMVEGQLPTTLLRLGQRRAIRNDLPLHFVFVGHAGLIMIGDDDTVVAGTVLAGLRPGLTTL